MKQNRFVFSVFNNKGHLFLCTTDLEYAFIKMCSKTGSYTISHDLTGKLPEQLIKISFFKKLN